MKGPGSSALRKGRLSVPGASYLITKNILKCPAVSLTDGENPEFLINWFLTAQRRNWIELFAYVVLPDHYHLVLVLGNLLSLSETIGRINENSGKLIKKSMRIQESFWQDGFHDHLIREREDVGKYIDYVHMNPVEAGYVMKPEEWPFSSAHTKYTGSMKKP